MLGDFVYSSVSILQEDYGSQQDGSPLHYKNRLEANLRNKFPINRIEEAGQVFLSAQFSDLTLSEFFT